MHLVTSTFDLAAAARYLYPQALIDGSNLWPSSGRVVSLSLWVAAGTGSVAIQVFNASNPAGVQLGGAPGSLQTHTAYLTPGGTLAAESTNPQDAAGDTDPGVASMRAVWDGGQIASGEDVDVIANCPHGIIIAAGTLSGGKLNVTWEPTARGAGRKRAFETTGEHMPPF